MPFKVKYAVKALQFPNISYDYVNRIPEEKGVPCGTPETLVFHLFNRQADALSLFVNRQDDDFHNIANL